MSSKNSNNNLKSPKLQAAIVEPILLFCIDGISVCELSFEMQRILSLQYKVLKKYLFYLINYELISYDGQSQVYITEDGGYDLLKTISKEKKIVMANSEDIVITLEGF
jgi:predicted transcriptional regulator